MLSKSGHHKGIIRLVKPNYSAAIGFQSLTLCISYTILPTADIDKGEGTMNAAGSTMEAPIYRKSHLQWQQLWCRRQDIRPAPVSLQGLPSPYVHHGAIDRSSVTKVQKYAGIVQER
jgi:hypothetical protein